MKAARKKILAASMAVILVLLLAFPFLTGSSRQPRLEISLISVSTLDARLAEFHSYDSKSGDYLTITQTCSRAELRFKNSGPGAIVLAGRAPFSLEIQTTNSNEWIGANQWWRVGPNPIPSGGSQEYTVRIPSDATKWRISTSYRRWHLPTQFLNYVARDWFHSDSNFGDQNEYRRESDSYDLKHTE